MDIVCVLTTFFHAKFMMQFLRLAHWDLRFINEKKNGNGKNWLKKKKAGNVWQQILVTVHT